MTHQPSSRPIPLLLLLAIILVWITIPHLIMGLEIAPSSCGECCSTLNSPQHCARAYTTDEGERVPGICCGYHNSENPLDPPTPNCCGVDQRCFVHTGHWTCLKTASPSPGSPPDGIKSEGGPATTTTTTPKGNVVANPADILWILLASVVIFIVLSTGVTLLLRSGIGMKWFLVCCCYPCRRMGINTLGETETDAIQQTTTNGGNQNQTLATNNRSTANPNGLIHHNLDVMSSTHLTNDNISNTSLNSLSQQQPTPILTASQTIIPAQTNQSASQHLYNNKHNSNTAGNTKNHHHKDYSHRDYYYHHGNHPMPNNNLSPNDGSKIELASITSAPTRIGNEMVTDLGRTDSTSIDGRSTSKDTDPQNPSDNIIINNNCSFVHRSDTDITMIGNILPVMDNGQPFHSQTPPRAWGKQQQPGHHQNPFHSPHQSPNPTPHFQPQQKQHSRISENGDDNLDQIDDDGSQSGKDLPTPNSIPLSSMHYPTPSPQLDLDDDDGFDYTNNNNFDYRNDDIDDTLPSHHADLSGFYNQNNHEEHIVGSEIDNVQDDGDDDEKDDNPPTHHPHHFNNAPSTTTNKSPFVPSFSRQPQQQQQQQHQQHTPALSQYQNRIGLCDQDGPEHGSLKCLQHYHQQHHHDFAPQHSPELRPSQQQQQQHQQQPSSYSGGRPIHRDLHDDDDSKYQPEDLDPPVEQRNPQNEQSQQSPKLINLDPNNNNNNPSETG